MNESNLFHIIFEKVINFGLTICCVLFAWTSFAADYVETENGYSVKVQAIVNGKQRSESHVIIGSNDQVNLIAQFFYKGQALTTESVRKKFSMTFWWYKILPSTSSYLDPSVANHLSEYSAFYYKNLALLVPNSLKYTDKKFLKEESGSITPDFESSMTSDYIDSNKKDVGSIRWKVMVKLEPHEGDGDLHLTSPGEEHLTSKFSELKIAKTKEVFLLARRGGTGFKVYDETVSFLGLPYIWWIGPIESRLGMTCAQLVSYAAFKTRLDTSQMHQRPGIKVTKIENGKFKGIVEGKEVFLEYGKHVNPGFVLVYYSGTLNRHAAMIGEDSGEHAGYLDLEDKMIHATLGKIYGGAGIKYSEIGKAFNEDTIEHGIKIIAPEK